MVLILIFYQEEVMCGIGIFAPPRRVVSIPGNGPVDLFSEQPAVAGSARGPACWEGANGAIPLSDNIRMLKASDGGQCLPAVRT